MASLKDLRLRIRSVKATQKITKAMKMVAAGKLRRAREQAEAARPYAEKMERMLSRLASGVVEGSAGVSPLIAGTGKSDTILLLLITSDRGLCGAFNGSLIRETKKRIRELESEGKKVKLFCIGKKGIDLLQSEHGKKMVARHTQVTSKKRLSFAEAQPIVEELMRMFDQGEFDICIGIYNRFKSAISQEVTGQQLIPLPKPEETGEESVPYEYEPDEEAILTDLLPRNLSIQVYRMLLESMASEQGARMTAMDNATRNAGDMIGRLTLVYNRSRQASITKELIEIISGAEAV